MYEIGTEVVYRGSIEALHNNVYRVGGHCCDGTRYRLTPVDDAQPLYHVRHGSVIPLDHYGDRRAIEHAITERLPVEIVYRAADGEETTRVIEPYEITQTSTGNWIVRAMDRLRGEPRTFRLDRILIASVQAGPCLMDRPAPDIRAALARIRAEIALIEPGYFGDAAHWSPGDPTL